jgi:hypothetical protein
VEILVSNAHEHTNECLAFNAEYLKCGCILLVKANCPTLMSGWDGKCERHR